MSRIVFMNPNPRTLISGGVKTVYRQAELLTELGLDAFVFQPDGRATWLDSSARILTTTQPFPPPSDEVLVFPENPTGWLAEMAQMHLPAKKVLFCQAQYYVFHSSIPVDRLASLGFSSIVCPSMIAKGFLERVFHLHDVSVIPCYIDPDLFFPREKVMQIAYLPHKLPREAEMLRAMLGTKYPHLRSVPWRAIRDMSERETAELLGRSTIYLSLPFLESFGLVPLEAMASGCIVVGFHGYGGLEYATPENGFWFPSDHLEEVVDALARVIADLEHGTAHLIAMREAGMTSIGHYTRQHTKE